MGKEKEDKAFETAHLFHKSPITSKSLFVF